VIVRVAAPALPSPPLVASATRHAALVRIFTIGVLMIRHPTECSAAIAGIALAPTIAVAIASTVDILRTGQTLTSASALRAFPPNGAPACETSTELRDRKMIASLTGSPPTYRRRAQMIVMSTARRLKPGAWEQFRRAWDPGEERPPGFTRAYHARNIRDEDEVISFGLFDMTIEDYHRWRAESDSQENQRVDRLSAFVEHEYVSGVYEVIDELE
jgi:hypothetical protein